MPKKKKKKKAVKAARPKKAKAAKPKAKKSAKPKPSKALKPKKGKTPKAKKASKALKPAAPAEKEQLLSSEVVFEGSLFRVLRDRLIEPGGRTSERDVVRHNGSVVILAIDSSKSRKNPWIVVERQYRHAARQFL